jgi:hypothetical protein
VPVEYAEATILRLSYVLLKQMMRLIIPYPNLKLPTFMEMRSEVCFAIDNFHTPLDDHDHIYFHSYSVYHFHRRDTKSTRCHGDACSNLLSHTVRE